MKKIILAAMLALVAMPAMAEYVVIDQENVLIAWVDCKPVTPASVSISVYPE
jgi:hypothetical protein